MPRAKSNGIEIEYECFGDPGADPMLLIMGLGAQMILWDEGFCEGLAERGHYVVRYDNRDVGLSTKLDEAGPADLGALMVALATGQKPETPYLLSDMADDAAGLLDALEIERAHVVGASMGGMIAQTLAVRHPRRVRSLVSMLSTTGNPELPPAKPEAMAVLTRERARDREGAIEQSLEAVRVLSGPGFAFDEARFRRRAERLYDRCNYPDGITRHMAAIVASGSRVGVLPSIIAPTLVIHGDADPLVPLEGGLDTARLIPGAQMRVIEGMGHDLPEGAWPEIIGAIVDHAAKA